LTQIQQLETEEFTQKFSLPHILKNASIFFDSDAATGNGKIKKNLIRKNQVEPLEIIIKHKPTKMKKERKFSTNFELMTTFPNASNPKKNK
jgi:hypothetical protein